MHHTESVCCTRGSCLEYPDFKSYSLPTHETSLISMATLSLSQPYYKHRRGVPWCSSENIMKPNQTKPNQTQQLLISLVYQYGHCISQSPPSSNRTKGRIEKKGDRVRVALVVPLATRLHSSSLMQKQLQDWATCYSHTPLTIQDPPWGCEKWTGFNIHYVTSCHVYYSYHEVCNRAEGKDYYFSAHTF